MKTLFVLYVISAVFVGSVRLAHAQQAKIYRVGVLVVGGADIAQIKGLRDGLKELRDSISWIMVGLQSCLIACLASIQKRSPKSAVGYARIIRVG
jgi:hypothetical protein